MVLLSFATEICLLLHVSRVADSVLDPHGSAFFLEVGSGSGVEKLDPDPHESQN
jgi:hypothetical protein